MDMLSLPIANVTTQITPPEANARYYLELFLMSGILGNLGEDVRLLQSHWVGEIITAGSTSSTMAHKTSNPIIAEQDCGMHINVYAECQKVMFTLISDLQRDLRWSSVMRSYSAAMTYQYQQLKTTERLFKTMEINKTRCRNNFDLTAKIVMAELLHTALQQQGFYSSHEFVNKVIVPQARTCGNNLLVETEYFANEHDNSDLTKAWKMVPANIKKMIATPERYIGNAVEISKKEAKNKLQ
jgi:adenylosuccinate lyase